MTLPDKDPAQNALDAMRFAKELADKELASLRQRAEAAEADAAALREALAALVEACAGELDTGEGQQLGVHAEDRARALLLESRPGSALLERLEKRTEALRECVEALGYFAADLHHADPEHSLAGGCLCRWCKSRRAFNNGRAVLEEGK